MRCTLGADGVARIDRAAPGRGAWLCRGSMECFDRAVRRRGFERAWRRPVAAAAVEQLRALLAEQGTALSGPNDDMRDLLAAGANRGPADVMKD